MRTERGERKVASTVQFEMTLTGCSEAGNRWLLYCPPYILNQISRPHTPTSI